MGGLVADAQLGIGFDAFDTTGCGADTCGQRSRQTAIFVGLFD